MHPFNALLHLQLKYCERCGGLWLRPDGADTPYCPPCEQFMSELPVRPDRHQRKPVQSAYAPAAIAMLALVLNASLAVFGGCA
jgi:hypothetical protein